MLDIEQGQFKRIKCYRGGGRRGERGSPENYVTGWKLKSDFEHKDMMMGLNWAKIGILLDQDAFLVEFATTQVLSMMF